MCMHTAHAHAHSMRNPLATLGNASHMALPLSLYLLQVLSRSLSRSVSAFYLIPSLHRSPRRKAGRPQVHEGQFWLHQPPVQSRGFSSMCSSPRSCCSTSEIARHCERCAEKSQPARIAVANLNFLISRARRQINGLSSYKCNEWVKQLQMRRR